MGIFSRKGGGVNKHGSKWIRKAKRVAIYMRDDWTCVYCETSLRAAPTSACTLDHVVPRSAGGSNDASNLVTACLTCNATRRDMRLRDFVQDEGGMRRVRNALKRRINVPAARAMMQERMAA